MVDARHELDTLTEDNLKPLDSLLRSEYPTYVPYDESDESGLEEDDNETGHSDEEGTDQVKSWNFADLAGGTSFNGGPSPKYISECFCFVVVLALQP